MLRRLALPVALAALLIVPACAAPAGDPLSTGTTDASSSATEQGTTEQGTTEGASEQGISGGTTEGAPEGTSEGVSEDASESAAASTDAFGSTAAALNTGEPGLPRQSGASIDDVLRLGAVATWVDAPSEFAISLPATSECWASAGEPLAVDGRVVVGFQQGDECGTADAARTYTLTMPEGIDTSDTVEIAVDGLDLRFTLALPGQ